MKTFVIGDIHGHWLELHHLMMDLLAPKILDPKKDRVVFLGDYVDGGPQTKEVIEALMGWQKKYPHWVVLYGNHEDLMLDALIYNQKRYGDYYLWWNQGGRATFRSYVAEANATDYEKALMKPIDVIPKEHIEWLKNLPLYFEDENYFYVHAGLRHGLKIENCKKLLKNGTTMRAKELSKDMIWIRDEFINSDFDWGKKIIFGHTAVPEPIVQKNKIGIDTMTRMGGRLTAVELPGEIFHFQKSTYDPSW